jgi:hypothetical protein
MQFLSVTSDILGIIGFIISLFAISGVIKINRKINSKNVVKVKGSTIGGDFTGRDKTSS